jgi:hypothetical protein
MTQDEQLLAQAEGFLEARLEGARSRFRYEFPNGYHAEVQSMLGKISQYALYILDEYGVCVADNPLGEPFFDHIDATTVVRILETIEAFPRLPARMPPSSPLDLRIQHVGGADRVSHLVKAVAVALLDQFRDERLPMQAMIMGRSVVVTDDAGAFRPFRFMLELDPSDDAGLRTVMKSRAMDGEDDLSASRALAAVFYPLGPVERDLAHDSNLGSHMAFSVLQAVKEIGAVIAAYHEEG